jgi:predicted amidohydrolase YtcJ
LGSPHRPHLPALRLAAEELLHAWIRIGALKLSADGSASERTMCMSTPYVGRPDDFAILTMLQEELNEGVEDAHTAGWRVTVSEALRICTINGAWASFEESMKGSITVGKLADFVMLADDPHDVEPSRLKDIRIVRTVVGGKTVHEA